MTLIKLPDGSWVRADSIRAIYRFDGSNDRNKPNLHTTVKFIGDGRICFPGDVVEQIAAAVNEALLGPGLPLDFHRGIETTAQQMAAMEDSLTHEITTTTKPKPGALMPGD